MEYVNLKTIFPRMSSPKLLKLSAIIFLAFMLIAPVSATSEEEKVTVPIDKVVKTNKLSAEQLAKSKVTVPRSWVDQDYLEEHFPQEGESKSKTSTNNIPDGTYTQKPEITSKQNDAIKISNFSFELTYDEGTLTKSNVTFSLRNNSGNINDATLNLEGEKQLAPTDGKFDESVEDFSYTMKGLKEGNLYRGTLEVSSESSSDTIDFKIYPREFVNIADDDDIKIVAHYYPWHNSETWDDNYVHTPVLGLYSSKNEEVINKHIDWATGHGIDAFAIAWNGKESWTDQSIKENVLQADLIDHISFFLTYDQGSWVNNLTQVNLDEGSRDREEIKSDFEYFNDTYFEHPQYVEINGKKPVYMFGTKVIKGDIGSALEEIREISNEEENGLYIVGDELDLALRSSGGWVKERIDEMKIFDGVSAFTLLYNDYARDFQQFVRDHEELHSKLDGRLPVDMIPYVQAGNNDRKIRPQLKNPILKKEPSTFRDFCQVAQDYTEPGLNMVFVTSFNEWHEDNQIEPAKEYGFKYLKIIKNTLAGD